MSHAYHHARPYIAGGAPQLLGFPNCQLLIDPDLSIAETYLAPRWSSTDIGWLEYRSTAADNLNVTDQLTYEFWFQPCETKQFMIRGYASRGSSGTSTADQQWYIQSAHDGGNHAHGIEFTVFNGAGTGYRTIYRPAWVTENNMRNDAPWSHCVCIYDGRETASTDRARIYLNGKRVVMTANDYQDAAVTTGPLKSFTTGILKIGRIETAQKASNQPAILSRLLGTSPVSSSGNGDALLGPVRLWNSAICTAADGSTPAIITTLWNRGRPRKYSDIATSDRTNLVVAYDFDRAAYQDATTNAKHLTCVGTLSGSEMILGLRCLATGRLFTPQYGDKLNEYTRPGVTSETTPFGNGSSGVFHFGRAPHKASDPVSGRTVHRYEVTSAMVHNDATTSYLVTPSGDLFGAYALQRQTTGQLEQLWHMSSYPSTLAGGAGAYFGLMWATRGSPTSGFYLGARARNIDGTMNGAWTGGTTILTTNVAIWNFTGDTAVGNTMRYNGADQGTGSSDNFSASTPTTNWAHKSTGRSVISLGKLYSQGKLQGSAVQLIGTVATYGPRLGTTDNRQVERILRDMYGV